MNNDIKQAILNGQLVLFLGAGASRSSKDRNNNAVLDGWSLAKHLADKATLPYENESLDIVYSAVKRKLAGRLDQVLEDCFRYCKPSHEYLKLAEYPWRRIYTLNIDDAFETALIRSNTQNINIRLGIDPIDNRDPLFSKVDFIKLNGSVSTLYRGIIFSSAEYAQATAGSMPWYQEVAVDYTQSPFLFIGTKLDEPLLKFHIENYKKVMGKSSGISFVITPSATEIEKLDLLEFNLVHISGTFEDFAAWLQDAIPTPPKPMELAIAETPQFATLFTSSTPEKYARLFEGVMHVTRSNIAVQRTRTPSDNIRPFYKGFKPTWRDLAEEIPAQLDSLPAFLKFYDSHAISGKLLPILGPSGAGKTTLLMQVAYKLSERTNNMVYYIGEPIEDLESTIEEIDKTSNANQCIVAINDLDISSDQLERLFSSERLKKTVIVGSARLAIWNQRTKHKLQKFTTDIFTVNEFSLTDVPKLLNKLEMYGEWTRLGKLTEKERINELVTRAQRQLLIALLEATSGRGFEEIISDEYHSLGTEQEKIFFLIVGLATVHRREMPISLAERTLSMGGIQNGSGILISNLAGIVRQVGSALMVRHSTYIRYLLSNVIDPVLTKECIKMLLQAFSLYTSPIVHHAPKKEFTIYKSIVNHKFLFDVLKGKKDLIFSIYQGLEKRFEQDGLYWLQYGLSLRDFGFHLDALEKLHIACAAHPMEHTEHALAQQLLIVACQTQDKYRALGYLDEARLVLERLDATLESDDTYPLVTLAEGHTRVIRNFEGDDEARSVAASYAEKLKRRYDRFPDELRLKDSWEALFRYATTGTWSLDNKKNSSDS